MTDNTPLAAEQAQHLAEQLANTLDTVGFAIKNRACELVDAKASEINRISGGLINTTEEQKATLCDLECARMRGEFAEQVNSVALAYAANIATA